MSTHQTPPTPGTRPTLGEAALISGGARMAAQVMTWLITLLTVRLLAPADYGQAGVAMTVLSIATLVVDLGLGPAIQAMPEQPHGVLRAAHTVATGVALLVALLLAIVARPLAAFFGDPALRDLLLGVAVGVVFEGMRAVPTAQALRAFRFRAVARADFYRALLASLATIALALAGAGAWSLVGGAIVNAAVGAVLMLRSERLSLALPASRQIRSLMAYGRVLALGRMAWQVWNTADLLTIGRLGSMAASGHFTLAKTFAHLPQDKLLSVLMGVMQSYLATSAGDRPALRRYFLELTELIALAMGLPLVGLLVTAPDVLPPLLGDQWHEAADLVRLLIPSVFLHCIGDLANKLAIANGRAATPTSASVVAALVAVPWYWGCFAVAGPAGVAVGTLAIALLINGPGLRDAMRQTGASALDVVHALRPLAVSGLVMTVAIHLTDSGLSHLPPMAPALRAVVLVGVGGAVGAIAAVRWGGRATRLLWASVRARMIGRRDPGSAAP